MTVQNTFGSSITAADARDTLNDMLARIATAVTNIADLQSTVLRPITISFVGDSNAQRYLEDWGGTPNDKITKSSDGTTFTKVTVGRFALDLGNKIVAATNRPVRFLAGGVSGTTASQWELGGTTRDPAVNQMKNAGRVDLVIMPLGFNDVNQGGTFTYAGQLALLRRVIANIRTATGYPDLKFAIVTSQDVSGNTDTLAFERMAEMTIALNDANCYFAYSSYDLPTFDNIHLTEAGTITAAARAYPQVMRVLTGSAQVRGPRITAIAAVSATQTRVTLAHGAGTDFIPTTGITGFVIAQGSNKLAISAAVRENSTSILLTHATTGGTSAYIYYSPAGVAADDTTVVHDNGALTLPLELSQAPIEIIPVGGTGTPPPADTPFSYGPTQTTNTERLDTTSNTPAVEVVTNGSGGITVEVGTDASGTKGYRIEQVGDTFWVVNKFNPDGSVSRLQGADGTINASQLSTYDSNTSRLKANTVLVFGVNDAARLFIKHQGTVILYIAESNIGYVNGERGSYARVQSAGGNVQVRIARDDSLLT